MAQHKLHNVPDDLIIDLSSSAEDLDQLIKRTKHAKKQLKKGMVKGTLGKVEVLLNSIPDSPSFLKSVRYEGFGQKSNWFGFKQREANKKLKAAIKETRSILNDFIENGTRDPRKIIKRNVNRFKDCPDMQALNAIYLFNASSNPSQNEDVSLMATNRMDQDRLRTLKKALQGMMSAIFNGCISVFYIIWFVQIYNEYLNTLDRLLKYNYSLISDMRDPQFDQISKELYLGQLKVITMIIKKEELEGFKTMSRKITNSSFAVYTLTPKRIRSAVLQQDKSLGKQASSRVNANNVIVILMSILQLFAKIPAFTQKNLVRDILKQIPNTNNEIELRKRVIMTTQYVNEYRLATSIADQKKQKSLMRLIYQYSLDTIQQISEKVSSKWHVSMLMRISWVALNSTDYTYFTKSEFKQVLLNAYKYLGFVIYNSSMPATARGKEDTNGENITQAFIDKTILTRSRIINIGTTHGYEIDPLS